MKDSQSRTKIKMMVADVIPIGEYVEYDTNWKESLKLLEQGNVCETSDVTELYFDNQ
jgi:hypothetical protein